MIIEKYTRKIKEQAYAVFRIFVGLLFMQHGLQKVFGIFSDNAPVKLASLFGIAGVIELFGGLLIALGLLSRLAALITGAEMLVAYFMVHFKQGYVPILNGGELALLYFAAFLVILVSGNGIWSVERSIAKKESF